MWGSVLFFFKEKLRLTFRVRCPTSGHCLNFSLFVSSFLDINNLEWLCCFKELWYLLTGNLDCKGHCHSVNVFGRNVQVSKFLWKCVLVKLSLTTCYNIKRQEWYYLASLLVTFEKLQETIETNQLFLLWIVIYFSGPFSIWLCSSYYYRGRDTKYKWLYNKEVKIHSSVPCFVSFILDWAFISILNISKIHFKYFNVKHLEYLEVVNWYYR